MISGYSQKICTPRYKIGFATGVYLPLTRDTRREHLRDVPRSGITKDCGCILQLMSGDRQAAELLVPICRALV